VPLFRAVAAPAPPALRRRPLRLCAPPAPLSPGPKRPLYLSSCHRGCSIGKRFRSRNDFDRERSRMNRYACHAACITHEAACMPCRKGAGEEPGLPAARDCWQSSHGAPFRALPQMATTPSRPAAQSAHLPTIQSNTHSQALIWQACAPSVTGSQPADSGARPRSAAHHRVGQGVVGVVFCVLCIQRGREKSAKGTYLEISSSSKH
jgi:hypothetical protein